MKGHVVEFPRMRTPEGDNWRGSSGDGPLECLLEGMHRGVTRGGSMEEVP